MYYALTPEYFFSYDESNTDVVLFFRCVVVVQKLGSSTVEDNKKNSTDKFAVMEYGPSLTLVDGRLI